MMLGIGSNRRLPSSAQNGRNFADVEKGSIDLRQLETLDMYAEE
jgi:hypothetical protein